MILAPIPLSRWKCRWALMESWQIQSYGSAVCKVVLLQRLWCNKKYVWYLSQVPDMATGIFQMTEVSFVIHNKPLPSYQTRDYANELRLLANFFREHNFLPHIFWLMRKKKQNVSLDLSVYSRNVCVLVLCCSEKSWVTGVLDLITSGQKSSRWIFRFCMWRMLLFKSWPCF